MATSGEKLGLALGFIGTCLFAGTLPETRLAVAAFDPFFLTAARATLAGMAGLGVLLATHRKLPPTSLWPELAAAAICTVLAYPLLAALSMMTVPAAHGGVVLGILPLATAAAAVLLAHERPSRGFWLASLAGAGIVLIFVFRRNDGAAFGLGDVFLLGLVVVGALGYTLSGRLTARMPGWEVISWQVAMLLPVFAVATILLWPAHIGDIGPLPWTGLAYVAFVSQYTAFFVFNAGLAMGGIARVGQMTLLQPFLIVALAWPVNGEPISLETLGFAAAVVATVLIGQRARVRRRSDASQSKRAVQP
jgi:drug/metabolite transporter (DMT)-like permease